MRFPRRRAGAVPADNEGLCPGKERRRHWHARMHAHMQQRWRSSVRVRIVMMFVVLALVMAAVFVGGMKRSFSSTWAEAAQPMLMDYADRLVAELGTPPTRCARRRWSTGCRSRSASPGPA